MKYLLLGISCYLVAAKATGQVWENMAVRRAVTHDMLLTATMIRIFPVVRVPLLYLQEEQIRSHAHALEGKIKAEVIERVDLLQSYVDLLYGKDIDVDKLSIELYAELAEVATQYVLDQKPTSLAKFTWTWGGGRGDGVAKLSDASRQHVLAQALRDVAKSRQKIRQREGSDTPITELYGILSERMDDIDRRSSADVVELYQALPHTIMTVTEAEIAHVHKLLTEPTLSFSDIMSELDVVTSAAVVEEEGVAWQQQVHLADIFNRRQLNELIEKYYNIKEVGYVVSNDASSFMIRKDLNNPRNSAALYALDWQTAWQVTWDNLREKRTLSSAWGELMLAVGLDWQTLGQLVYPDDKRSAAYFAARIIGIDIERVNAALQAYRATLQDDTDIASVDVFLAELPHLREKNMLMIDIAQMFQDNLLTEDQSSHVGLDGNSPYDVLQVAMEYTVAASGRWNYLDRQQLTEYKHWYVPAFNIATYLHAIGLTEAQLRQHVFTAAGFDKLQRGEGFERDDLAALRRLLGEDQVTALLRDYDIEDRQREILVERLQILPLIVQLEGFVHKLAGYLNSDAEFLQALESIADGDMYAPLALLILELHRPSVQPNKKGKRRRKNTPSPFRNIRNALAKISEQINVAQNEYLAAIAAPTTEQHAQPTTAPNSTNSTQQHQQAQAAQRELRQQVTNLAKQIGRNKLPSNTPMWLRLRALLAYLDANAKELGRRAAMKNISTQRFAILLDPNSRAVPTQVELDSIVKALTQHTLKRAQRAEITSKERSRLLESMTIEIEAMQALLAMANSWK